MYDGNRQCMKKKKDPGTHDLKRSEEVVIVVINRTLISISISINGLVYIFIPTYNIYIILHTYMYIHTSGLQTAQRCGRL
jgi:hypothetical protein